MPDRFDSLHTIHVRLRRAAGLVALATAVLLAGESAASSGAATKRVAIVPQPTDGGAIRVEVGEPVMLAARQQGGDGALLPFEGRVNWNSSNPTVVQVTSLGDARSPALVTPLRPGIASVTITYPAIAGADAAPSPYGVVGDVVTLIVEDRS